MPLVGFKYPDGEKVSIEDVSRGDVDVERMGVTLPALLHMAQQRDPNRKTSTTELLNGTCQAYLERTTDFYTDPQSNAFSLAGTLHHEKLEDSAEVLSSLHSELPLEHYNITGIVDLYDEKNRTLIDYKNTGSYKVAQCLGLKARHGFHPTEVYKRSGRWGKKGTPKRIKEFYRDKDSADFGDWAWQLNFYKLLLEKNNYPVDKILIQITVRDGGLQVARERGVDRNIYLLEVPIIHKDHVTNKFLEKRDALEFALKERVMPEMCNKEETWGGVKCESYCPVSEACIYYEGEENDSI